MLIFSYVSFVKVWSKTFSRCKLCNTNKQTVEVKLKKLGCSFCIAVEYKIKRKFTFFGANTKYIISCSENISIFTHAKHSWKILIFQPHSMKFIWHSPQKSKYPQYTDTLFNSIIFYNVGSIWPVKLEFEFITIEIQFNVTLLVDKQCCCKEGWLKKTNKHYK